MSLTGSLIAVVILQSYSIQSAEFDRVRRDNPVDEMKTMAAMGIGMAQNAAKDMMDGMKQGVSLQSSKKVEMFGSGIVYNHSMSIGGSASSSESSEENGRRRRSFSEVYKNFETRMYRKRRQVMDRSDAASSNTTSPDTKSSIKYFLRQMGEAWREIVMQIRKWIEGTTNSN